MDSFKQYLCELADGFFYIVEVRDRDDNKIIENKNCNTNTINFNVVCNKETYDIKVDEKAHTSIPLLKYILEKKIEEYKVNKLKDSILYKILENKEITKEEMASLESICKDTSSIIIIKHKKIDKKRLNKLEQILEENVEYYCLRNEHIVIFNKFDNIDIDIYNLMYILNKENILVKKIVYDKELNNNKIKSRIEKLEFLCGLIDEKDIGKNIFTYQNTIFEILLNNIDKELEKNIHEKFKKYFDKMNDEMIKTIDTFFDKDLSLSETSKSLYIHRNTLVYRLDKIKKDILLDLRNFNDAINFYTIYRVWKNLS